MHCSLAARTEKTNSPVHPSIGSRDETRGLWLAMLGVLCFALALPAARLAAGTPAAPALPPGFVMFGSAALAGVLSAVFLLATRAPLPRCSHLKPLMLAMLGNAAGYLLLLGDALRPANASRAMVMMALLPLVTAALAAWVLRQRARLEFWLCALTGGTLAVVFALLRAYRQNGGFGLAWVDLLLAGAVITVAVGYVHGAQVALALGAGRTVCWGCALALVFTLPGALLSWPAQPVPASAWGGLVCLGMASIWAGLFAWYRALALGGALRMSQAQWLQPFLSIAAAGLLPGQALDPMTLIFAVAAVVIVMAGRSWCTR
ncbi:MAG: DMT family transporter [Desulfovibrionaceae bacterium]|nr:DMT family transporter [Desulfovibrionaceae bacterium]